MAAGLGQVDSELLDTRKSVLSSCERGDLSELQRVLEETEFDIGSEPLDSKGQTALHIACANGHLHIAQYLVREKECNVMVEDEYGHNPFVLSLINKHWKVAEFLLTVAPSSDNFKKHIGLLHYGESLVAKVANEAFTESCSSGYFQLVKFLKKKYDIQISEIFVQSTFDNGHVDIAWYLKFGEQGASPNHIASQLNKAWASKQWSSAKFILKFTQKSGSHESIGLSSTGLDQLIEVVPFELHTFKHACFHAFNTACSKGYLEVVRYLHEKGLSSPTLEPLDSIRSKGHLHIVHFLLKYCKCTKRDDISEIHIACIVGDEEMVTSSLARNGDTMISITDRYGMNALHYASRKPKILRMIIAVIRKENTALFNTKDLMLGNTPLHYAVLARCTESVRLLLRVPGCDINLVSTKRETPLHLACRQSDIMILEILVTEEMCDVNIQDDNGDTALHIAACSEWNSAEKIQCLLECDRCDPNITNKRGYTPLHIATVHNQLDSVRKLLNSTKCNPNIQDIHGNTALHLSIRKKSATGIKHFLMCDKVDVNIQNEEGNAPLHVALITVTAFDIIEKLIGHQKCNPSITNHEGMTPLQLAFKTDQLSTAELLLCSEKCSHEDIEKAIQSSPCLLHRTMSENISVLFLMIVEMKECNKNEVNHNHQTALHVACIVEDIEYIQKLTQQPTCDLNIQDDNGDTALHIAACSEWNSAEKIQCLLECDRCDPNITNTQGCTPLHTASEHNQLDSVRKLLNSTKCNPNIHDIHGNTALHCSLYHKSATVIEHFLMCDKVNINIQNEEGNTPLHIAVITDATLYITEKLIGHPNCNPNITNHEGMTPLQLAFKTDQLSATEVLLLSAKVSHEDKAKAMQGLPHRAIHADRMLLFIMLIEMKEFNVNEEGRSGQTPLHVACIVENMEYIQALLQYPTCDLNIQDDNGDTALHIAACSKWDSAEKIQCLLECDRCDPNITNKQGYTPLQTATEHNQLDSVRKLLNSTKCNPNIQDIHGNTALHCSICHKSATVIEPFLMCDKVNINIQNKQGNTLLHIAAITDATLYITEKLIGHPNCNPCITNHEGMTPLQLAFKTDQVSATEILLLSATEVLLLSAKFSHEDKAKAMQGFLHCAIRADRMPLFIMLIDLKEFNVNEEGCSGQTPLHVACIVENMEYIQALIQYPTCDLNIQDGNGDTALHIAARSKWNSAEKIQCLLECDRCDPNITNKQGYTPLHTATVNSQFDSVKILLNSTKCNPNIQDIQGNTALHLSIHQMSDTVIEHFLMCDKVDVNIQNGKGNTTLHVACTVENIEYIQKLTQQPTCDLNIQDDNGDTALHIAACSKWNSAEKIQCILDSDRCDTNITNKQGYTPLHTATVNSQFYSVKILLNSTKCNPNIQDLQGNTALHLSIRQKSATGIEPFLMCDKVDVNIQNRQGDTSLHVAVKQEIAVGVIEALAHHVYCNVSIINNEGMTPLQLSVSIKRLSVANVIAKKCSHEDIKKIAIEDTSDVLYNAVSENCVSLVQALAKLQRGKVNLRYGSYGETLLHAACRNGYAEITEILLEYGAEVLAVDINGEAPINNASVYPVVLKILLENGANVQAIDSNGDAPIHIACNGLRLDCLKAILQSKGCDPNQQNADGDTALHIVCRMRNNDNKYFVQTLLSMPGIDPEITNYAGVTPAEVAGTNYLVIQTINNFLKQKQSSLQTYLKIFAVGNSGTGKSTLIKAVTTEASQLRKYAIFPKMKFVNPSDVPPHTAGIVPIPFNSKHFGHAVLYDFAGQHEYYSSHAAVMENLILPTPPLFLLLIDISKPMEEIKEELVYWWQFINNLSQRAAAPPHVMFVASHKDKVRARGENPQSIIDKVLKDSIRDIQVSFKFEGSFPMNCRKLVSQGLTALLTQLNTTCQVLRQTADVGLHCHILKALLTTAEFNELVVCQILQIMEKIKSDEILLPQSSSQLIPLLSTLSDQGHILLLQNHTDVNKSWVILKPEVLLAEVNGSIFAPDYFKEHFHNFAMSTGVVTLSKIRERFTEFHHEVLVEFLIHLEFCFRIKDKHTLELITKNEVSLTSQASEYREEYYLFPSLVRYENPEDVCLPQETGMYQCGWFYKCGKETEQLTTRFLHVLILRLAFSCEPPDDPTERESVVLLRSCSVWKHGISWWTDDGIETIVEVGLQCRWVAVMMRCPDTHRVQCAELRSKVIAIVLKVKQDFCPAITMNEFLIAPSSLQYPFEGRELTLYSMRKIASIVVEGKDFAKDIDGKKPLNVHLLLPFEPYYKLGDLIGSFFSAEQSLNEEISQECLKQIAMKCHENLKDFETALQPNLIAYEEECSRVGGSEVMKCVALFNMLKNSQKRAMKTWRDFEREFSRFSIFCGRNPMVTTTTLCS